MCTQNETLAKVTPQFRLQQNDQRAVFSVVWATLTYIGTRDLCPIVPTVEGLVELGTVTRKQADGFYLSCASAHVAMVGADTTRAGKALAVLHLRSANLDRLCKFIDAEAEAKAEMPADNGLYHYGAGEWALDLLATANAYFEDDPHKGTSIGFPSQLPQGYAMGQTE